MSSASDRLRGAARGLALAAALLVGANLRPAITSVSTLLDQAASVFFLSEAERSLLATLPMIAFGVTAPLGAVLARRIGTSRALLVAMTALAVSLVTRVLAGWMLLPGTFLAGAAIMMAATLLPPYLKSLGAGGGWVGLSSMSFGVGAALGASLAVPLEALLGGAAPALGVWALFAVLAGVAMALVGRGAPASPAGAVQLSIASEARVTVVLMTAVFSLQSLLYFAVTTWLPSVLTEHGADRATAGWLLAWFSLIGLVPTLLAPVIARRRRVLSWFGPGLGLLMTAGFVVFALTDGADALVVTLLGVVQNAGFGLAMGLLVSLAMGEASAAILSAIAQGVGYAVAGGGSLLLGMVHDATEDWTLGLLLMAGCGVALSAGIALVIRRRPVSLVAQPATDPDPAP